ncbi:MAG: PBP1A family penicillin-binding protein [Spirochaetes bacterium]|nr:PBP1A family penicillin-binding protein [Spirochaetota bacterium]
MTVIEKIKHYLTLQNIEKSLLVMLLVYSLILGSTLGFMYYSLKNLTGIKELEDYRPSIPTKLYDINGRLISEYFIEQRKIISIDLVPRHFIEALIAVEDQSFYTHKGINFQGIIRAFIVNILSGYIKEGGSTLTQQLSKTLFTSRKRSYFRKIKEVWYALQMEKIYTKEEILEFYFNEMYFGHGAYGIEAAAKLYFDKPTDKLTLAEGTLLAGLPAAPNKYSPLRNPVLSMKRHWKVFKNMASSGIIEKKEAKESYYDFWRSYQSKIISPNISLWKTRLDKAPYFTEYIRQKVEEEFGTSTIYEEGLKIYTTLDLDYQTAAQEAMFSKLKEQNELYYNSINIIKKHFDKNFTDLISLFGLMLDYSKINQLSNLKEINRFNNVFKKNIVDNMDMVSLLFGLDDVQKFINNYRVKTTKKLKGKKVEGALISIEPQTGQIAAMVGGSGFSSENQMNRAVQSRRQIGSAFKPFVYIAALDTGKYTPATTFIDEPILYIDKEGNEWIPNNYSGKYYGLVTLRKALMRSINIISVKLADDISVEEVHTLASRMLHIYDYKEQVKYLPNDLSLALGTASVTPLQMANAFAILANNGRDVIPYSIRYIKDRNNNMVKNYEVKVQRKYKSQIITPQITFLITQMLTSVLKSGGTAWNAAIQQNYFLESAGKTGTTDNWKDTWFVGYNRKLATAVWVGFDDPSISLGLSQDGGHVAAPIWMNFMKNAFKNRYAPKFNMPEGIETITICRDSGKFPSNYCKDVGEEYFLKGTGPTETCIECKDGYKQYDMDPTKIDELLNKQRDEKKEKLQLQFKGLKLNKTKLK